MSEKKVYCDCWSKPAIVYVWIHCFLMRRKGMVLSQNKCFNNPKTTQFLRASLPGPPPGLCPGSSAASTQLWSGKRHLAFSLSRISLLKSWQVWKVPFLGKNALIVVICVKFLLQSAIFKSFQRKKNSDFSLWGLCFLCCGYDCLLKWPLIPRKPPCPKTFLVMHLYWCYIAY